MWVASTKKQLARAIKIWSQSKSSIEKILLRRHNPRYIGKSIELVIRNDGAIQKDVWRKKHAGKEAS